MYLWMKNMIFRKRAFRLSLHVLLFVTAFSLTDCFDSLVFAESFSVLSVEDFRTPSSIRPSFLQPIEAKVGERNVIRLKKDGVVRSRNPVWNVCISGKPIRKGLLMRNTDAFDYRRGHLHLRIPFTCRDYHRGNVSVWRHPDFPDVDVLLDSKGRLIGGVPFSYIAVRD